MQGACNLYYNVCGYDVCNDLEWTPAPGEQVMRTLPQKHARALSMLKQYRDTLQERGFCSCGSFPEAVS